jgi:hypothetical protein
MSIRYKWHLTIIREMYWKIGHGYQPIWNKVPLATNFSWDWYRVISVQPVFRRTSLTFREHVYLQMPMDERQHKLQLEVSRDQDAALCELFKHLQ